MPLGIEPEVTRYMWRIVRTLVAGLLWMLLQVIAGVRTGYAFADDGLTWKNILYYAGGLVSLLGLLYYYYRIWKK